MHRVNQNALDVIYRGSPERENPVADRNTAVEVKPA
jgi:hypothetical protein